MSDQNKKGETIMDFPCTNKCEKFTKCREDIIMKANRLVRVRCRPEMFSNMDRFDVYDLIQEELYGNCKKLRTAFNEDEDKICKKLISFVEPHIPSKVPPKDWRHFLELEAEKEDREPKAEIEFLKKMGKE